MCNQAHAERDGDVGRGVPLRPSSRSGRPAAGWGDATVGSSARTDPTFVVDSAAGGVAPRSVRSSRRTTDVRSPGASPLLRGTATVCGSGPALRAAGRNRSAGSGSGSLRGRIDELSATAG